uniref:Fatty acyl-CoA reductase C-terminal domain-containing protein n=1 Tax=Anopheles dirus TaxID=7168 RepID=A0A182NV72_9DIPT
MQRLFSKMVTLSEVLRFFCLNDWKMTNANIRRISDEMSPLEAELFPLDIRKIDWTEYYRNFVPGVIKYAVQPRSPRSPSISERKLKESKLRETKKLNSGLFYLLWSSVFIIALKIFKNLFSKRYDLLLEHLDFEYIRQSNNVREVENIVKVLRSGEEGYFPQLTAFAEERLKSLRPDSKLLRKETPLATQHTLPEAQWNTLCSQLNEWQTEMKSLSNEIRASEDICTQDDPSIPPVRKILPEKDASAAESTQRPPQPQRIKSCDYAKWDKFDPDTEMLKMDLDEERHREMVRINNRKNSEKPKIVELPPDVRLTQQEKQVLAGKLREKGNDYFRAKEFPEAVEEYGKSLDLFATAACFNNRAMAYIKLNRYNEAIADCDQCLAREPENLKALLRKAQALTSNDKRREAYKVYCDVLRLEPTNTVALSNSASLRRQLADLPPPNAFRMTIEEVSNAEAEIDFSALVRPKKIVKDRLPDAIRQLKTDTTNIIRHGSQAREEREKEQKTLFPVPAARRTPLIEEL